MMQYLEAIESDLINVTRLFGLEDDMLTAETPRITWQAWEADGSYRCRCCQRRGCGAHEPCQCLFR